MLKNIHNYIKVSIIYHQYFFIQFRQKCRRFIFFGKKKDFNAMYRIYIVFPDGKQVKTRKATQNEKSDQFYAGTGCRGGKPEKRGFYC